MNWVRERNNEHGYTNYHRTIGEVFELYVCADDAEPSVYWSVSSRDGVVNEGKGRKSTVPEAMTAAKECAGAALDKARVELEATTTEVEG